MKRLSQKQTRLILVALILIGVSAIGLWKRRLPQETNGPISITEAIPQPLSHFEDFGLVLDKLNISAPIIPNVDGLNEKIYYAALKKGVAQFKDSATPDKPGNLFIFGHSSYLPNVESHYKEVFKKLNELQAGDEFIVYYQSQPYRYRVTKSYETHDEDWNLADPTPQKKDDKTITLMTCWPPGTTTKRWAVIGEQI